MSAWRATLRGLLFTTAVVLAIVPGAQAAGDTAFADIKGRDGKVLGRVILIETTAGVLFKFKLEGLAPGRHGFHIHEAGKCEGDFSSSGSIYNPLGGKHGFLNDEGPMAGDLPNIVAGRDGIAEGEILSPFVTLSRDAEESLLDSDGSSLIVREREDDHKSHPIGGSGAPIACGVVAPVN